MVVISLVIHLTHHYKYSYLETPVALLWQLTTLLHLDEKYPYNLRLFITSVLAGFGFFVVLLYVRQYALRFLLAYRGWMCTYSAPRTVQLRVK